MEKMPPVRNAKGVNLESMEPLVPKAMASSATKTIAKIFATVEYCAFRYASAPSRIAWAISVILSVPSDWDMTAALLLWANPRASREPIKPIAKYISISGTSSLFCYSAVRNTDNFSLRQFHSCGKI